MPDAERLAALMTQLGYPTGADAMRSRLTKILAREDFRTWIADVSGNVVAMAGVQLSPSYERDGTVGRLVAFVVDEAWRRLGIGALLLKEVEQRLSDGGIVRVVVNAANHRSDAHAFYRGLGYQANGLRFAKALE
jgi:GNAT superfamily N-acetyltransferase